MFQTSFQPNSKELMSSNLDSRWCMMSESESAVESAKLCLEVVKWMPSFFKEIPISKVHFEGPYINICFFFFVKFSWAHPLVSS